jgi:methyl-accepting chemotaxis protein
MAEFGDVYQKIENAKQEVELVVESAGTIAELLEEMATSVASLGFHARAAACRAAAQVAREGMSMAQGVTQKLEEVHHGTVVAQESA